MENRESNSKKYYTVDVLHILKFLWAKIYIILLAAFIAGGSALAYSVFFVEETYSATVLIYVNNNSILGDTNLSISASDITASQSLVNTYSEILNTRTTLERVKDESGLKYTTDELSRMIKSGQSNDTEIMYITVTATDAYDAAEIANCIADVLPVRIDEIIDNAKTVSVDRAVVDPEPIGPSYIKYTVVGLALGMVLSIGVLTVITLLDDRIHNEDYILENYEYPILAKIPDLVNTEGKKYGYYYQSKSRAAEGADVGDSAKK